LNTTFDLADLSANIADDLEVGGNTEGYVDQLPPAPPPEDNYVLRIDGLKQDEKDGNPVLADGRYPVLLANRYVIVEPTDLENRSAASFVRIATKPFERVPGKKVSPIADITRAFDVSRTWTSLTDGLAILKEMVETGRTLRARIVWEAFDTEYYNQQLDALGGKASASKEQIREVSNKSTVRGMRKFTPDGNGGYLPIVVNPHSGNTLNARTRITQYFPSNQTVKVRQSAPTN
jgi:hypothetical protein